LKSIAGLRNTIVVLETPHRVQASLNDMLTILGNRRIAVCRELTKIYEQIFRGTVSQAIEHFIEPRGEFTLVVEGKTDEDKITLTEDVKKKLREMRLSDMPAKEAVEKVTRETGISKKEVYREWLGGK
jgi:16S rRNA (cytidine1402-2'-O)-methyltransferase